SKKALVPQAFLADPLFRPIERADERIEHFVDAVLIDDERRAERNRIASNGAADQALLLRELDDLRPDALAHVEALLGRLVLHQLDAGDEANTAGFAHERMIVERIEPRLEDRGNLLHMSDDVDALVDFERLHGDGAGNGVAGVGE